MQNRIRVNYFTASTAPFQPSYKWTIESIRQVMRVIMLLCWASRMIMTCSAADRTEYWYGENPSGKDWLGFSKHFYLPIGGKVKGVRVERYDPVEKKWRDETGGWTPKSTPLPGGAPSNFNFEVDRTGAKPVSKGTQLRFWLTFNTTDLGFSQGTDVKYPPDAGARLLNGKAQHSGVMNADIDNAVFAGGVTGLSIPSLGLVVPANKFAYLYQINNLSGLNPLSELRLSDVGSSFSDFQVLGNNHNGASFPFLVGDDPTALPGAGTLEAAVALFDGFGSSGIMPLSWRLDGSDAVARFADLLAGQSSSVFVGISSMPPRVGRSTVTDGATSVDSFSYMPVGVPEPTSTFALLCIGVYVVLGSRPRVAKRLVPKPDSLHTGTE